MTDINSFSKTKILCTLGPATNTSGAIEELISSGMSGVRFNMSHGSYNDFDKLFGQIEIAVKNKNVPLAILADLQGPKIRIGEIKDNYIEVNPGDTIEITIDNVLGTQSLISTSYKQLTADAVVGDNILINDGLIRLTIKEIKSRSVICTVNVGGVLSSKKGMNLPGMKLSTPSVTEKDYQDLQFLKKHKVDYIALSFVREAKDILELKDWLKENGFDKPVIAKIEKKEAIDNLEEILDAADGIMIARGDLGVELMPQEVPLIQKAIIKKCNERGKLVITATQMLESMITNPIPTRAEASDVANAVWDGTDVIMLSGETSVGKYASKAVCMMRDIAVKAESSVAYRTAPDYLVPVQPEENVFDSINKAVASISRQINASAIGVFTYCGKTAVTLSKFRPGAKIIAVTNSIDTMNKLSLNWGVCSVYFAEMDKEHLVVDKVKQMMLEKGLINKGDSVIFTAGTPYPDKSRSNWIRYELA
jgi:pyruvate kinase